MESCVIQLQLKGVDVDDCVRYVDQYSHTYEYQYIKLFDSGHSVNEAEIALVGEELLEIFQGNMGSKGAEDKIGNGAKLDLVLVNEANVLVCIFGIDDSDVALGKFFFPSFI